MNLSLYCLSEITYKNMSTTNDNVISTLREEQKRLAERMREIDRMIKEKEKENRVERIKYILTNPIDDEDYMYVLKNYSVFYKLLLNVLGGISYELDRKCADVIVDDIIYKYKKSRSFIDWLDTVIFNAIWDFSRKKDAEEYIFTHKDKISDFIEQKINPILF